MSERAVPWPTDEVGSRLMALADAVERDLGEAVQVTRQVLNGSDHPIFAVGVIPARPDSLRVDWLDFGIEDLQVQAGHEGGRWELGRELTDVDFIESIVRSVIAGRVVETFGPGRSKITVTLADGSVQSETGGQALAGCLPIPGWVRLGRRVQYAPYG